MRDHIWETEHEQASWIRVPFRMFLNVAFLGTLLQMEFGGLALKAALASASAAGVAFAAIWIVVTFLFGEGLSQMFLRALLIFGLIGLWFTTTYLGLR